MSSTADFSKKKQNFGLIFMLICAIIRIKRYLFKFTNVISLLFFAKRKLY